MARTILTLAALATMGCATHAEDARFTAFDSGASGATARAAAPSMRADLAPDRAFDDARQPAKRPFVRAPSLDGAPDAEAGGHRVHPTFEAEWHGVASCQHSIIDLHLALTQDGDWVDGILGINGEDQQVRGVATYERLALGDPAFPFVAPDSVELNAVQSRDRRMMTGELYDADEVCSVMLARL